MAIETLRETYARNLRRKGYQAAAPKAGRWYFTVPPDVAERAASAGRKPGFLMLGSRGAVRYGRAWSNSVPVSARFLATIAYLD